MNEWINKDTPPNYSEREKYFSRSNLENKFLFGNMSQLNRIDPLTFDGWMRILFSVEDSYLVLLKLPLQGIFFKKK